MAESNTITNNTSRRRVLLDPYRPQQQNQYQSFNSEQSKSNPRVQGTSALYSPMPVVPMMAAPQLALCSERPSNQNLMGNTNLTGPPLTGPHTAQHFMVGGNRLKDRMHKVMHGAKNVYHRLRGSSDEENDGRGSNGTPLKISNPLKIAMIILQYICWALHLAACFYAFWTWTSIANHASGKGMFLKQKAYFTTDQVSASLHMGARGYITASISPNGADATVVGDGVANTVLVEFWNTSVAPIGKKTMPIATPLSILDYMQPVSIKLNSSFYYMTPFACNKLMSTDGNKTSKTATNMDIASWKACRLQDIPSILVDVAYPSNSHIWFSSNNSLFLIYVTLFVTWAICTAYLPFFPKIWTIPTGSLWIWFSVIALLADLGFVIMIPNSQSVLNVPVNNVVIGVALHILTIVMVALVARQRDRVTVHSEANHTAKQYFGYRISADGMGIQHIWRTAVGGKLVTQSVFSNELQQDSKQWVSHSRTQHSKDLSAAMFSADGNEEEEEEEPISSAGRQPSREWRGPLEKKDQVAHYDGLEFFVSRGNIFEAGFYQDRLYNHMDAVTLKYFEYAMTAGLFLSGVLMSFYPYGNIHMYQTSALGMMLCNLVAIPMHKVLLFATKLRDADPFFHAIKDAASAAVVLFILASWFFFIAGIYSFSTMSSLATADGVPDFVVTVFWGMMGGFILFGVLGTLCTGLLAWNLRWPFLNKMMVKNVNYAMSFGFEFLNLVKAIIGFVILQSAANATGFL